MVRRNGNGGGDVLYSSFKDNIPSFHTDVRKIFHRIRRGQAQVRGRLALVKSRRVTEIEVLKPDRFERASPHSAAASRA